MRLNKTNTTVVARWNLKNRFVLAFFHGLLVASLFYTAIESHYESALYEQIVYTINSEPAAKQSENAFLLKAMHITHQLLNNRQPYFNRPFTGIKTTLFYPTTFDLTTANGACGSYSRVLARILQTANIKVRFAEMEVNGQRGGHIVLEANTSQGWVVLDALYDLHFKTPNGKLASFADVQHHWPYYKTQVPLQYNLDYRYEDVHYTNWNKIPVLLPMVKKVAQWFLGKERTAHLSLRTYFLQPYYVIFCGILSFYAISLLMLGYKWLRTKQRTEVALHSDRILSFQ